jgi:hypothetical protein
LKNDLWEQNQEVPITLEVFFLAEGELNTKSYTGIAPPNHHFLTINHQARCLLVAREQYQVILQDGGTNWGGHTTK